MNKILSPSILAADFWDLGDQISVLEEEGVKYLHIDVMDGMFVPDISFGMPVIESLRKSTALFFDVHLMINEPERYLEEFARCGADLINIHLESTTDVSGCLAKIHELGKKAGITIKPGTPVSELAPYLDKVDMVLIMTVEPGFGGQKIMPECLTKVTELRRMCDERGIALDIEVDGGITKDNIADAYAAGANVIVAGSAVFRGDVRENVKALLEV